MLGLLGSKLTVIAAALAIASVGAWGGFQYVKLQRAQAQVAAITLEREAAVAARDQAIAIANQNADTIKRLQEEKIAADAAFAELQARKQKDRIVIKRVTDVIERWRSDPTSQQELSPVLRDTVRQIDAERRARGELP